MPARAWSLVAALTLLAGFGGPCQGQQPAATEEPKAGWNVRDFGAAGDGKTDDTSAFQRALDAAGAAGGGIVSVPTGNYFFAGHLSLPDHVTMEGVFRGPTARSENYGSTLLVTEGKGDADGEPFLFLHANSTLKGLTIFYPEQSVEAPTPYPWCIRGIGDNVTLVDLLLTNPWQAVDFATHPCGRHLIRGLYSQAIHRGLQVDRCLDVGRIQDVHFWPFWANGTDTAVVQHTKAEGIAFSFGRTDWEYVSGCFAIWYNIGMQFIRGGDEGGPAGGPGNVLLNQSGSDICQTAVLVRETQPHAGVSFTNCQLYGDVIVEPTNNGMVRFTGCGLFGSINGAQGTALAKLAGAGRVSFDNCTLYGIDPANQGEYLVEVEHGRVSFQGCEFVLQPNAAANPSTIRRGADAVYVQLTGNDFSGIGPDFPIDPSNQRDVRAKQHFALAGARWWPIESLAVGTEVVDLAPNGDFAEASGPDAEGRLKDAAGWNRVGPAFVEPPAFAFPDRQVMVGRPGVQPNEQVGQYYRALELEPDTDYVLSGYLWSKQAAQPWCRVFVDILGDKPVSVPSMPSIPGGIFFAAPFNSNQLGGSPLLRVWYDHPVGYNDDRVAMQAARLAITKADRFKPPSER